MKKVLISEKAAAVLLKKNSFLNRNDVMLRTASTQDEALKIHRTDAMDLIITELDLPGMDGVEFCAQVRRDKHPARIIMICANTKTAIAKSARCKADAVFRRPVKSTLVLGKAGKFLAITWRDSYRVLLNVTVEGNVFNELFSCRSLDISPTGMLIETTLDLSKGDRLTCSFFLPDAHTTHIETSGVIVRTVPAGRGSTMNRYGVHFTDISLDAMHAITAFLSIAEPKPQSSNT